MYCGQIDLGQEEVYILGDGKKVIVNRAFNTSYIITKDMIKDEFGGYRTILPNETNVTKAK